MALAGDSDASAKETPKPAANERRLIPAGGAIGLPGNMLFDSLKVHCLMPVFTHTQVIRFSAF
jgi:hypothetical protein